jgi:hypothetical protein
MNRKREYDQGLAKNESLCTVDIQPDGNIHGWCATLKRMGYPCPLDETGERKCEDCHCG